MTSKRTARIRLFGLPIDALTMEQSVARCLELIALRGKQHVVLNAAKIVMAQKDAYLREVIESCGMVNADGMSVVWASRILKSPLPGRVTGIDLMYELVKKSKEQNLTIYLLGGTQAVVESTALTFSSQGANIVGVRNGYWVLEEETQLINEIAKLQPDLLFIALPSPKKEYFLHKNLNSMNVGLALGVGGSFDVVAGKTKRAPHFFRNFGFEWLYRLIQEPNRLFIRYFVGNSKFIYLVMTSKIGKSKY